MDDERRIAGIDEAGRGPLAGPVVAAAVILDPNDPIEGLKDSKQLTEKKRENLYDLIIEKSFAYGIGRADVEEIDEINILQATFVAMQRAVLALKHQPEHIVIDGHQAPAFSVTVETIVKGDQKVPAISAASILAKVTRDREMVRFDEQYPVYGFAKHKGYGTKAHLAAIAKHGPCPIHRQSFAPVRNFRPLVEAL